MQALRRHLTEVLGSALASTLCWGCASHGQLATEETITAVRPADVRPLLNFKVTSPNGMRTAYAAMRNGSAVIVVDDYVGRPRERILPRQVGFSPDSRHLVFLAQHGSKVSVVQDDSLEGEPYDDVLRPSEVGTGNPVFSPTSAKVAYVATKDTQTVVVANGVEQPACHKIFYLMYSSRADDLIYVCDRNSLVRLVVNGVEQQQEYERLLFRPVVDRGGRIAYVGLREGRARLVLDGDEVADHSMIREVVFSPTGSRMAYAAEFPGEGTRIVVDGVPGRAYVRAGSILLGESGGHVAYQAGTNDSTWVVTDGSDGKPYILIQEVQFDSAGSRVIYKAGNRDGWRVVTTAGEHEPYSEIVPRSLQFSPDGNHISYVARKGALDDSTATYTVVRDGQEGKEYVNAPNPAFSPDSRHLAYIGQSKEGYRIVVDNIESKLFRFSMNTNVWFTGNNSVFTHGYNNAQTVRVTANW